MKRIFDSSGILDERGMERPRLCLFVGRGLGPRRALLSALTLVLVALTMALATPLSASANVLAWGANYIGQLGNGTSSAGSNVPVEATGLGEAIRVAAGGAHGLALLEDGTVMAWGANTSGQLGGGTSAEESYVPVKVPGLGEVTAVAAGGAHSLALLKDGTVMAWGLNGNGQLGDGTNTNRNAPVKVTGLSEVAAVAAGESHSVALLKDGRVMAWGHNQWGQLGDGTYTDRNVPVEVRGLGGVTAVAAGFAHTLALLKDGTVVAWGYGAIGQLGNGTSAPNNLSSSSPVQVTGLSEATAVAAGNYHSLALLNNGTVMAWGNNGAGELGDGTNTQSNVPVKVTGLSEATAIAGGGFHSLALLKNRTVAAWGENKEYGQLGDGANTDSNVPVQVAGLGEARVIASRDGFSLAVKSAVPAPVVTGVKPKKGPVAGTSVEISGANFPPRSTVSFGSTAALSVTVNSPTSITALAPVHLPGRVDVTVTGAFDTSTLSKADRFKYTPTITQVSQNTGSTAGGESVTITGTGFLSGQTIIRFGRVKATAVSCTSWDPREPTTETTCTVITPPHVAETVDVKAIVNKVSSPRNRLGDQFTYS